MKCAGWLWRSGPTVNPCSVSVIIATRDRPALLERLLLAIRAQDCPAYEVIVVDDGSTAETRSDYRRIWMALDERFQTLLTTPAGAAPSGPAACRNRGIAEASGQFVAFCDDDDRWIRSDHLRVAVETMTAKKADAFFANMRTAGEEGIENPDWYAPAKPFLEICPLKEFPGIYEPPLSSLAALMKLRFIHMDTLVCRRSKLQEVGCFWEGLMVGEDANLGFRLCDASEKVLFRSEVTGELNVTNHDSANRRATEEERILFSIMGCLQAEMRMRTPALLKAARQNRSWKLTELGRAYLRRRQTGHAARMAFESLMVYPSAEALRLMAAALFVRNAPAAERK